MAKQPVSAKRYVKRFVKQVIDDRVFDLSAQLAYYFLLSLFPFLIFALSLLHYVGVTSEQVLELMARFAPENSFHLIENNLQNVLDKQRGGLLSFGIILTIWSASHAINAIMRGLNRAYGVEENRPFLLARGIAVLLTLSMVLVIVVALALPVFGQLIGTLIFSHLGLRAEFLSVWIMLRWFISFLIIVTVFSCLYYFAPNKKVYLKDVLFGAVMAAVGWQVVSLGFSYYVNNFGNYDATYGSLGAIIVLMIWFYLTALIIIIGGEINAVNRFFANRRE